MTATIHQTGPLGLRSSAHISAADLERLTALAEYDLWFVEERLRAKGILPESAIDSAVLGFRRYIALRLLGFTGYPVPSESVDEVWHAFLLFTQEYQSFCHRLGGFIHHVPFTSRGPKRVSHGTSYAEVHDAHFTHNGVRGSLLAECGCSAGCSSGGSDDTKGDSTSTDDGSGGGCVSCG